MAPLDAPIEQDLSSCFLVFLGASLNYWMLTNVWAFQSVGASGNGTVSNRLYFMISHELEQLILNIEGMKLNLIACWWDSSIAKHIPHKLDTKVRNSNTSH